MGRQDNELLRIYRRECKKKLCDNIAQKKSNNVYVTLFCGLSLQDYSNVRKTDCQSRHFQLCLGYEAMLSVAHKVITEGYCMLSQAFKLAFPHQV